MIYSIGHSTLSQSDFLKLIEPVDIVLDIRSHPGSKWPWFAKEQMREWLPTAGKEYGWLPGLGGWMEGFGWAIQQMAQHGVDVSVYMQSKFPKQRIAKSWPHAGIDPACPLHSCSSHIVPEIHQDSHFVATNQSYHHPQSSSDVHSLPRLYGQSGETSPQFHCTQDKHTEAGHHHNDATPQHERVHASASISAGAVQPPQDGDYSSPHSEFHDIQNKSYHVHADEACSARTLSRAKGQRDYGLAAKHRADKSDVVAYVGLNDTCHTSDPERRVTEPPVVGSVDTLNTRAIEVVSCTCDKFYLSHPDNNIQKPSWQSIGLFDYSWFMTTPHFMDAANYLINLGEFRNVGVMCAEALYWRCHRSMVADYVVYRGGDVLHLQPKLTSHKAAIGNRLERYDKDIIQVWKQCLTQGTVNI